MPPAPHPQDRFSLYETPENLLNPSMNLKKQENPALSGSRTPAVTFDDLLVAVGATRNRDAFIRLFEHFAPRIKSFLMKGGMTPEQADDLAQETMLTVWSKAPSYNPAKASASTWIFTIARNRRIDVLRKNPYSEMNPQDPLLLEDDRDLQDDILNREEEERALAQALAELPEDQADMIRKSFFEDKTHSDIAAETSLPLGTVKSRIRLAMDKLRYHLEAGKR